MFSLLVVFYLIAKRLYNFDPRSRQISERYERIEGWLLLPAIGITLWPFITLFYLASSVPIYRSIFDGSSSDAIRFIVATSLVLRLILLTVVGLTAILFWNRRTSTPNFLVAAYLINFLSVMFDAIATGVLYDVEMDGTMKTRLFYAILLPAIWLPAFFTSERARGTFTQRLAKESN